MTLCKVALSVFLSATPLTLLNNAPPVFKQESLKERSCKAITIWKEARGESLHTQRAVLDVVNNRMKASKQACTLIVKAPGQFPWASFQNTWKASPMQLKRLDELLFIEKQLPSGYVYFNTVPHPWAKNTKKIGKLYFHK